PARLSQVALPHLHANSTGLSGFVRILRISPRLPPPHSPPPHSIKMRRRTPTPPTAHVCVSPQTEQSSDRFISRAAGIILRHRSFLLSINKCFIVAFVHPFLFLRICSFFSATLLSKNPLHLSLLRARD